MNILNISGKPLSIFDACNLPKRRYGQRNFQSESLMFISMSLLYLGVLAASSVIGIIYFIRPYASKFGLIDEPDERKSHKGQIPLLGGPIIAFVYFTGLFFVFPELETVGLAILPLGLVLAVGIWDDIKDIYPSIKLAIETIAAIMMVSIYQLSIGNIELIFGPLQGMGAPWLYQALTVFSIVLVINAFNMLDGIDGLCATLALLALQHTALAINILDGSLPDWIAFTSIYLSGCLVGFLAFNLQRSSKRKIFLGDSGAMFLGLVVSVLTIVSFGQSGTGMTVSTGNYPAIALWVLAIPLADILTTSITRILSGKNPMAPDQTHIHHRLIDAGLSKLQALTALVFAAVVYFWIGFFVTINFGNTASVIVFGLAILSVLRLPATSVYLLALAKIA